jgi:hypothetical protein
MKKLCAFVISTHDVIAAYSCGFLLNAMAAAIHKMLLVPFLRRGVSPSRFPAAAD